MYFDGFFDEEVNDVEVLHFCWLQRAYPVGKYLIKFSKNEETYGIKDSIKGIEDSINLDGCSASVVTVNFGKYWLIWFFLLSLLFRHAVLKSGQTYFEYLAVWTLEDFKACLVVFQHYA